MARAGPDLCRWNSLFPSASSGVYGLDGDSDTVSTWLIGTCLQHKVPGDCGRGRRAAGGVCLEVVAVRCRTDDGASTGKDEATGNLATKQYRVQGPVMLMLTTTTTTTTTTTAIDVDEELLNRCLVLTINETREQTRAIHARQRAAQTLEGLLEEGPTSTYDRSITKRGSEYLNVQMNVTVDQFQANLISSGYSVTSQ